MEPSVLLAYQPPDEFMLTHCWYPAHPILRSWRKRPNLDPIRRWSSPVQDTDLPGR